MSARWEYQVIKMGGTFRGYSPEDLEEVINEAAEDDWEPFLLNRGPSDGQLILILRRQGETPHVRRQRKWRLDWP